MSTEIKIKNEDISPENREGLEEIAETISAQTNAMFGGKGEFRAEKAGIATLAEALKSQKSFGEWLNLAVKASNLIRLVKCMHDKDIDDTGELVIAIANKDIDEQMATRMVREDLLSSFPHAVAVVLTYPNLKEEIISAVERLPTQMRAFLSWDSRKSPREAIDEALA